MIAFLWIAANKLSHPNYDREKSDYQAENLSTLSNYFTNSWGNVMSILLV